MESTGLFWAWRPDPQAGPGSLDVALLEHLSYSLKLKPTSHRLRDPSRHPQEHILSWHVKLFLGLMWGLDCFPVTNSFQRARLPSAGVSCSPSLPVCASPASPGLLGLLRSAPYRLLHIALGLDLTGALHTWP